MALFLVFDHDNTHPDPVTDRRGCYKLGDIVEVLDDSKHDGDLVKNPIMPPWYLLKILGVASAALLHAMEPERNALSLSEVLTRRRFSLDISRLPAATQEALLRDRYAKISLGQARASVRSKRTGEPI